MQEYTITADSGMETTVLLSDEDAKARGLTEKAKTPTNKQASPANKAAPHSKKADAG